MLKSPILVVDHFLFIVLRTLYKEETAKDLFNYYCAASSAIFSKDDFGIVSIQDQEKYAQIKRAFYLIDSIACNPRVTIYVGLYDCSLKNLTSISLQRFENIKEKFYRNDPHLKKQTGSPKLLFSGDAGECLMEQQEDAVFVKCMNSVTQETNMVATWIGNNNFSLCGFKEFYRECIKSLYASMTIHRARLIYTILKPDETMETQRDLGELFEEEKEEL